MNKQKHVLLYDGVCVLCNRLNAFVLQRDQEGRFAFASLQSSFAENLLKRYGRDATDLDTVYCLAHHRTGQERLLSKAEAALFVLGEIGGLWRILCFLRVFPLPLLNLFYDLVARNRYRVFGRYKACLLPQEDWKERFIDT